MWFLFQKRDDNVVEIGYLVFRLFHISYTATYFKKQIDGHSDPRTLLALSDVLREYGITSTSLKLTISKLLEINRPFIIQMKSDDGIHYFSIVKDIGDDNLTYLNPYNLKWQEISIELFAKFWTGIVSLLEKDDQAGEPNYYVHKIEENRKKINEAIFIFIILFIIISGVVTAVINYGILALYPLIYFLFLISGILICSLLIWNDIDFFIPIIKSICSGKGTKTNCKAVLQSDVSKILGISWSEIGFAYFCGLSLALLMGGIVNTNILWGISIFNIAALPYTIFSIYYQFRIAKNWCRLCTAVQIILIIQAAIIFNQGWIYFSKWDFLTSDILSIFYCILISFLIVHYIVPVFKKAKAGDSFRKSLNSLLHDTEFFNELLVKQPKIMHKTSGLGITLGNPNGKMHIIKVCNPYCGPCSIAHKEVDNLLKLFSELQIQIIFTASSDQNDIRSFPVKHLMAIAQNNDSELTKIALDDWYLSPQKDYESFAVQYPMNGELERQNEKLNAMFEWCQNTKITYTPTFFINGYQMPNIYNVSDLKYLLSY